MPNRTSIMSSAQQVALESVNGTMASPPSGKLFMLVLSESGQRTAKSHVAEMLTCTMYIVASPAGCFKSTQGYRWINIMIVRERTKALASRLLEQGVIWIDLK